MGVVLKRHGPLESVVHRKVHATFGGEGLVLLSDQDPASYPTPNAWGNAQDMRKGRREGRTEPNGCDGGRVSPIPVEPHSWKAVCYESSPHGLGKGSWKRAEVERVGESQSVTTFEKRSSDWLKAQCSPLIDKEPTSTLGLARESFFLFRLSCVS